MTESAVRVGVIGAGMAARTAHLPALLADPRFTVVGIADRDEQARRAVSGLWPGIATHSRAETLLECGPAAVIVATPPDSHDVLAGAAIRRGCHVLVEKPLAPDAARARALVTLASDHGVTLSVGHEKRFQPTLSRVRSLVRDGAIGAPFFAGIHWGTNVKLDPDRLTPPRYRTGYQWRWRDRSVGGGILQDHLPHYLDLVRWWTGQDPVRTYAIVENIARHRLDWPESESVWDDFTASLTTFDSGLTMRFETSVVGRSMSPIYALGSGIGEWTEYGYLLGTKGQLLFDLLPWDSSEMGRLMSWQVDRAGAAGQGWTSVEQPEPDRLHGSPGGAAAQTFGGQLSAWYEAIHGRPSEVATGRDGMLAVAAVDAAYRSARCGSVEPIRESPEEHDDV